MEVGDAVLYQGVNYAHGRITPNPNAWSAHLFLHFVDRNGPLLFADPLQNGRDMYVNHVGPNQWAALEVHPPGLQRRLQRNDRCCRRRRRQSQGWQLRNSPPM